MSTKLYVNNLATAITENDLMDLVSAYGHVVEVNLPVDRASDHPRSFGFITMITPEAARAAIQALDGKAIGTGTLTVSETWPHEEPAGLSSGGRNPRRRASHLC